jgi:hypothetical protein
MSTDTWHASDDLLTRFATQPETVDPVTAASVEQHLVHCEQCRRRVAIHDTAGLDILWDEIADRIDQRRRPGVVERALQAFRLDPGLARLVAATPALRVQGLIATVVVSIGAAMLARSADSEGPFLALAPLIVLGLVALSFAPGTDPGGEIDAATPLHGGGLFARRAVVVLVVAGVALSVATAFVPSAGWEALGWIAPGLALSLLALALGTRVSPTVAAVGLAVVWLALVQVVYLLDRHTSIAQSVLFEPPGQLVALAVGLAAVVVLYLRREDLDRGLLVAGSDLGRLL